MWCASWFCFVFWDLTSSMLRFVIYYIVFLTWVTSSLWAFKSFLLSLCLKQLGTLLCLEFSCFAWIPHTYAKRQPQLIYRALRSLWNGNGYQNAFTVSSFSIKSCTCLPFWHLGKYGVTLGENWHELLVNICPPANSQGEENVMRK